MIFRIRMSLEKNTLSTTARSFFPSFYIKKKKESFLNSYNKEDLKTVSSNINNYQDGHCIWRTQSYTVLHIQTCFQKKCYQKLKKEVISSEAAENMRKNTANRRNSKCQIPRWKPIQQQNAQSGWSCEQEIAVEDEVRGQLRNGQVLPVCSLSTSWLTTEF